LNYRYRLEEPPLLHLALPLLVALLLPPPPRRPSLRRSPKRRFVSDHLQHLYI
jgi:hypothetical protein